MPANNILNTKLICDKLSQKCCQDLNLFSQTLSTPFWKLSDLAILYPKIFNIKEPIFACGMYPEIMQKCPELKEITPQPIHILNLKEDYFIQTPPDNTVHKIKHGDNQHFTRLACAYLFSKAENTETEEAYFLSPNKKIEDIAALAKKIKWEKTRKQLYEKTEILKHLISGIHETKTKPFSEIYHVIYSNLFNTYSIRSLCEEYNVTTTIINHIKTDTLTGVNDMFEELNKEYSKTSRLNIHTAIDIAQKVAQSTRIKLIKQGLYPEKQLSKINLANKSKADLKMIRTDFYLKNYSKSL